MVFSIGSCDTQSPPPTLTPSWAPGTVFPAEGENGRGLKDVRGLIHAHSHFSHDACDGEPVDEDGVRDPVCLEDFRRGLCQSQHDFVFLTDHGDSFNDTEYPDTLLFSPDRGDVLENDATANRITCDDGHSVVVMAGSENAMMPVGLERHLDDRSLYSARTPEAAAALHDAGAVILLAHPEEFTTQELIDMPVDGFEMYNLHANTVLGAGFALDLLVRANDGDTGLPHPDLLVLAIWSEDPAYLRRWGNVLASGKKIIGTLGTDCHRNTFRTILSDGERADSYRRMMISFSNHLMADAGADGIVDSADIKDALRKGRLYGAFENMGYPVGFDVVAEKDGQTYELGDEVPVGATIRATMPTVRDLNPARQAPKLRLRLLRATDDADADGFVEVKGSDGDLSATADVAGAYRVEVRMLPLHLRQDLGVDDLRILDEVESVSGDYVWIYANPFYVR
jgi:hypothetical protein